MIPTRSLIMSVTALLILLPAACSGEATMGAPAPDASTAPTELDTPGTGLSRVILLGDSVAQGQALAMGAALGVSDVDFHSMASDGGGTVVGPTSEKTWDTLPDRLDSAKPSTVIYQITSYDWGSEQEQRSAYERLLSSVTDAGAQLVFVTMPPIEPDDFYAPHMDELERASLVAQSVAEKSEGQAVFLDASDVWGNTYQRKRQGVIERSSDGIHTCPQGAARFTSWLLTEMAELYPDFTPPDAQQWANTGWAGDERFVGC